ncbi:unnamed protein product [Microthlaspi erraticum]|uniref:Reverse transcriptase zinc-binding domain-containing protein n=1 Tax=Microthlaspi erraticum TaxID=1685480 RepID=A0A6D2ISG0_9BRAS|nr:unnamed protein product [Microthlaspi erraticum]
MVSARPLVNKRFIKRLGSRTSISVWDEPWIPASRPRPVTALHVWALSPCPTAPNRFPTEALFANIAYLLWNLPDDDRMRMYPWLIWFIWKARNEKVFSNDDSDPNDIISHAAREATTWRMTQVKRAVVSTALGVSGGTTPPRVTFVRSMGHGN